MIQQLFHVTGNTINEQNFGVVIFLANKEVSFYTY